MKVFTAPNRIQPPDLATAGMVAGRFQPAVYEAAQQEYLQKVRQLLLDQGYTGPHTGEVFRIPWADGYAQYMVAERGKAMALVHLPLGDGWHVPPYMTRGLRKADILTDLARTKNLAALFNHKKGTA